MQKKNGTADVTTTTSKVIDPWAASKKIQGKVNSDTFLFLLLSDWLVLGKLIQINLPQKGCQQGTLSASL